MAGSQFTEEQIRRSLLTLAKHAGNSIRAAEDLEQQGITVSDSALRNWRNYQYRDLYQELHETYGREIEGDLIPEFRDLTKAATLAAHLAVEKTAAQLEADQVKDPAAAGRNLATIAGIGMDKLYLATDRPSVITENRNAYEILNGLESRYAANTVNSTAVEETEPGPLIPERVAVNAQESPVVTT